MGSVPLNPSWNVQIIRNVWILRMYTASIPNEPNLFETESMKSFNELQQIGNVNNTESLYELGVYCFYKEVYEKVKLYISIYFYLFLCFVPHFFK